MSVLTNYVREISESEDPKKAILKWVRGIEKEYVMPGRVIVAIYARPHKTSGGVILTDNVRQEDLYQGACGLLVNVSDQSFKYSDGGYKFEGVPPKLHDWVIFRAADSWSVSYNKAACRVLRDDAIMAVTKKPDAWY